MTETPPEPAIDPNQPQRSQSTQGLMKAENLQTVARYPYPVDSAKPEMMAELARVIGEDRLPPPNSGMYYLIHVLDKHRQRRYMVLGEGPGVLETLTAIALVTQGYETAGQYVAHRWTLT